MLSAWTTGRSAASRHPAMPDAWWCAHQDAPFSSSGGAAAATSSASAAAPSMPASASAVSGVPLVGAADFVLGPGGSPLLRLSPIDRSQIALFFAVLAVGYHTLRGADSVPPPDALSTSEGCFERARLLALTCADAPNIYVVATLLLLSHFSFGYMRFRAASIHASLAWRLARACGLTCDDGGLGSLCTVFRHVVCSDLDQLRVPERLLPTASEAALSPGPLAAGALGAVSGAAKLPDWDGAVGPPSSSAAGGAGAAGGGQFAAATHAAAGAVPSEALVPRVIDDELVAAAALCDAAGGRLLLRGSRNGAVAVPTALGGVGVGGGVELSVHYLDLRVSEVLAVVVARLVLLRRGLLSLESKRGVWLLVDELVEISALPGVALPLARLANIYGLKSITARQAGQQANAQTWALAAIGLWRRVPVSQIAHAFQLGFIARHVALIAFSGELQVAATAFIDATAGVSGRTGSSRQSTARSHSSGPSAARQLPAADGGLASSRASSGFDLPVSDRDPDAQPGEGLPQLHEHRQFAAVAKMFAAVARFWPVHANSFEGLLAEATAMLIGANESLARTLGLPAFRALSPASVTAQSFAPPKAGSVTGSQAAAAAAAASPALMGASGGAGGERPRPSGARQQQQQRTAGRRFGVPELDLAGNSGGASPRREKLMTSLVLESLKGEEQSGFQAQNAQQQQAAPSRSSRARLMASPLDLLCLVARQEQPLSVPPPPPPPPPAPALFAAASAQLPMLSGSPQLPVGRSSGGASGGGDRSLSARRGEGAVALQLPAAATAAGWHGESGASGDLTMRVAPDSVTVADSGAQKGFAHLGETGSLDGDDDDDDEDDNGSVLSGQDEYFAGGRGRDGQPPRGGQQQWGAAAPAPAAALAGSKRPRDPAASTQGRGPQHAPRGVPMLRLGAGVGGGPPMAGASTSSAEGADKGAAATALPPSTRAADLEPPPQGGVLGNSSLTFAGPGGFLEDTQRPFAGSGDSARAVEGGGDLAVTSVFTGPPTARLAEPPPSLLGGLGVAKSHSGGNGVGWPGVADDLV